MKTSKQSNSSYVYCFKKDKSAVFLNRWDEVIKEFPTYEEAESFASENIHLINKRVNRVIRFRAWSTHEKEMKMPEFSEEDIFYLTAEGHVKYQEESGVYERHISNSYRKDWDVMQYTGVDDKDGRNIYECDIISVSNSDTEENGASDVVTVCRWAEGCFTLEDFSGGHWARQLYHQQSRLTVIGNIYQNPELIPQ